jgi:hypothetical protein
VRRRQGLWTMSRQRRPSYGEPESDLRLHPSPGRYDCASGTTEWASTPAGEWELEQDVIRLETEIGKATTDVALQRQGAHAAFAREWAERIGADQELELKVKEHTIGSFHREVVGPA